MYRYYAYAYALFCDYLIVFTLIKLLLLLSHRGRHHHIANAIIVSRSPSRHAAVANTMWTSQKRFSRRYDCYYRIVIMNTNCYGVKRFGDFTGMTWRTPLQFTWLTFRWLVPWAHLGVGVIPSHLASCVISTPSASPRLMTAPWSRYSVGSWNGISPQGTFYHTPGHEYLSYLCRV